MSNNADSTTDTLLDLPYKQLKDINLKISSEQKEATHSNATSAGE